VALLRLCLQLVLLGVLYAGCQLLVSRTGLPVPPGLLALLVLIGLLLSRAVPQRAVDRGADLLLKYLPVIFLPPGIGVVRELHTVRGHGLALAGVLLGSLVVGQLVAGLVGQTVVNREKP